MASFNPGTHRLIAVISYMRVFKKITAGEKNIVGNSDDETAYLPQIRASSTQAHILLLLTKYSIHDQDLVGSTAQDDSCIF